MTMKRIYIGGPMTGIPEHDFPAFHAEAARLRVLGHEVVNPAEINSDPGASREECLKNDIRALLDCDALVLLARWRLSEGALLEWAIARAVGMDVFDSGEIGQTSEE
jgi:hypothetical protein